MAFDKFEPIGTRTVPDLLAFLSVLYLNRHRKEGLRAFMPQDILDDPLLPRRNEPDVEARRTAAVAADYRRLRAERLARRAAPMEASA